ncbi:hypothetical protein [Oceanibium sediminis]|nr:hypothetical protein [Oceanibium sediminis]
MITTFAKVSVKLVHTIPPRAQHLAFGGFLLQTSALMFHDLYSQQA